MTNLRQFNLPKHTYPHPHLKKRKLNSGTESCLSVHLKSQRNPPIEHTLLSQVPTTSVFEIKSTLSQTIQIPVEKIKLLHKKKPVPDSKTLKDLLDANFGDEKDNSRIDCTIQLSVMILGGTGTQSQDNSEGTETSPIRKRILETDKEKDLLNSEEFWSDLRSFLLQRLKNDSMAERVFDTFKKTIEDQSFKN